MIAQSGLMFFTHILAATNVNCGDAGFDAMHSRWRGKGARQLANNCTFFIGQHPRSGLFLTEHESVIDRKCSDVAMNRLRRGSGAGVVEIDLPPSEALVLIRQFRHRQYRRWPTQEGGRIGYAVAHWLANMDGRGTLARYFEPSLSEEKRQATALKVGFSASGSKRRVASADSCNCIDYAHFGH